MKNIEHLIKFIRYPEKFIPDNNFSQFRWLGFENFDSELFEVQASLIWREKFIDLRIMIENKLKENDVSFNMDDELLKLWQSLPNQFSSLKKLAIAVLTVFPSTYFCKFIFSQMNIILSKTRNRMTTDSSEACVALKVTNYITIYRRKSYKKYLILNNLKKIIVFLTNFSKLLFIVEFLIVLNS